MGKLFRDETAQDIHADLGTVIHGDLEEIARLMGSQQNEVKDMDPGRLQALVRSGEAAKYVSVGDQFTTPWTWNGTEYTLVWDVVHHFDGSDDDHPLLTNAGGATVPGMMLQCHYAIPQACVFSAKQPFYIAQSDLPAGTYNFTVTIGTAWGSKGFAATVGSVTYQFTTTAAHPKGAALMWDAYYEGSLTKVEIRDTKAGSVAESCTLSEGTSDTSLGTITQDAGEGGMNVVARACYGSNRWKTSDLRSWLNSDASTWAYDGGDGFRMPHPLDGKPGFLYGLDEEFRAVLGKPLMQTLPHACDGTDLDSTYDRVFPISAKQHGFNNYLSNTTEGFAAEGVALDYWTQLRTASGRTAWSGYTRYPELITYAADNHTSARNVWLRSAHRYAASANYVGSVYSSGSVSSDAACNAYSAAPAACIM